MCGIAGYSLDPGSSAHRTLAAQALLAGIAERMPTRSGTPTAAPAFGHRAQAPLGRQRAPRRGHVPPGSTWQVLVHVRDYTKRHPTIEANNHPIHGAVVGIHNGIIDNDEEIPARYG